MNRHQDNNNQPTNDPQGGNMEAKNDNRRARWTREDGTWTEGPADEMMQRYAASGFAGSLQAIEPGASMLDALALDLDEDTEDEPTEEVPTNDPVTVTPSATVGKHDPVTVSSLSDMTERREKWHRSESLDQWTQVEVHDEDKAIAEADEKMLRDMGLTPGRTWYAPGTPLNSWGLDKWKVERRALDDAPRVADACRAIEQAVKDERRKDYTVEEPNRLRLALDGGALMLTHPDMDEPVRLERHGLRGLSARYGRKTAHDWHAILPPTSYLESMHREEIVEHFNQRAPRILADRPGLLLRTREAVDGYGRSLFGVVSPTYGVCDVDQVAKMLREELPAEVAATMVYNPDDTTMTFEAVSMRDVPPTVGEVWKVGLKGGTGDNGGTGSRYRGFGGFWRTVCRNLTTEELAAVDRLHQRHRGEGVADKIREQIRTGWDALRPAFEQFSNRWEVLNQTAAVDLFGGSDVAEAIAEMVAKTKQGNALVKASEIERDALVQMLLHTHSAEPGETVADVVNAVTRLHESRVPARCIAAVESVAGSMAREWSGVA